MIGLTGAHRTGKSFLAKKFAEKRDDFTYLQTSATKSFADMGLDPAVEYPFEVRLDVQERILSDFRDQCRSMNGKLFIADRTPIDFMAYTLADVQQHNVTPELGERLDKYLKACVRATNEIFPTLVIVQPGIKVIPAPGKASLSPMYIEHVANLIMGITASEAIESSHFYIPRQMLDIDKRITCVESALRRTVERHIRKIEDARESGRPIVFH